MNVYIVFLLISIGFVFAGFYFWKKTNDKNYLSIIVLSVVAVLINIANYLISNIELSPGILQAKHVVFTVFWIAFVFFVLRILLKKKAN